MRKIVASVLLVILVLATIPQLIAERTPEQFPEHHDHCYVKRCYCIPTLTPGEPKRCFCRMVPCDLVPELPEKRLICGGGTE